MFAADVLSQKYEPPGPLLSKKWGSGPSKPPVDGPVIKQLVKKKI